VTRVVALGLDGAEWQLIEPMLESDALPNLRGMRRRGTVSRLRNSAAFRTSLVWATSLGGRSEVASPASGAIGFDPVEYQTWKIGARRDQVFFADRLDVRALTFDVPYLPLLQGGDSIRVSEWGPPISSCVRASHPAGLLSEIDALLGQHPAVPIHHKACWHQPPPSTNSQKRCAKESGAAPKFAGGWSIGSRSTSSSSRS
jgi:hypothetical protein